MRTLYLKKDEERRVRAGHLWVFSNEVDQARSPLKDFTPGETARLVSQGGRPMGAVYVNPAALICARVYSQDPSARLDGDLLRQRLVQALGLRERLFERPSYRLVFSEGDFLPGLMVDRFGDFLVLQTTTAAMDRQVGVLAQILDDLLHPSAILLKNDASSRDLEGLAKEVRPLLGQIPEEGQAEEGGRTFSFAASGGQKTGWFHDMRDNRLALASFVRPGMRVLDAFSYVGGLGAAAAARGGAVTCLDSSEPALALARRNAQAQGADLEAALRGDAFEILENLRSQGQSFDVVSVDPPAFIKRKKDAKNGLAAYQRINRLALDLVRDGGIMLTCSCSQHLPREELRKVLARAASESRARVQILAQGHQAADHPVHPAMPETDYLKAFLVRVLRDGAGTGAADSGAQSRPR